MLWVEVIGRGRPVTVFAHGVTGSTADLVPLAARTPGTRVLFDFRGHGRSECPPEEAGYGHDAMRRDLETVATRYGATRAFGISVGAGAILSAVADNPERFERVALFMPAMIDQPSPDASFGPLAEELTSLPLEEVARRALQSAEHSPLLTRRPYWQAIVADRIMRMNSTGVPRAIRAYASGEPPLSDAAALAAVRAPFLIAGHEDDPIHDSEIARKLCALLPNARLEIWPEPLAMYDDLESFSSMIGAFLGAEPEFPSA